MTLPSEIEISPAHCPFDVEPTTGCAEAEAKVIRMQHSVKFAYFQVDLTSRVTSWSPLQDYSVTLPQGMHKEVAAELLQWFVELLDLSSSSQAQAQ